MTKIQYIFKSSSTKNRYDTKQTSNSPDEALYIHILCQSSTHYTDISLNFQLNNLFNGILDSLLPLLSPHHRYIKRKFQCQHSNDSFQNQIEKLLLMYSDRIVLYILTCLQDIQVSKVHLLTTTTSMSITSTKIINDIAFDPQSYLYSGTHMLIQGMLKSLQQILGKNLMEVLFPASLPAVSPMAVFSLITQVPSYTPPSAFFYLLIFFAYGYIIILWFHHCVHFIFCSLFFWVAHTSHLYVYGGLMRQCLSAISALVRGRIYIIEHGHGILLFKQAC